LGFKGIFAPEMLGVAKFKLTIANPKIDRFIRFTRKEKMMKASEGELRGKKPTHIATSHTVRER
jgi:hypothetical protein